MSTPRLLPSLRASLPLPSRCSPSPSSSRLFAHSAPSLAAAPGRSAAYRPKRDPTPYGLAPRLPRAQWPKKEETDTKDHPLWRFFHGEQSLEVPDKRTDNTSRSWTAPELRRKSFPELHQLWYVLLRERNVLLTQREEARRVRVDLGGFAAVPDKLRMCQKSMARIKQVISERRHAALDAARILRAEGRVVEAEAVEQEAAKGEGM
ncbi:hypothetical protein JCM10207_000058 [Rhodosporidiobolus poonsookiae]